MPPHEWAKAENVCIYCGKVNNSTVVSGESCPKHPRAEPPPRAIPPSIIFAGDITGIGEEMRSIAAREGRPYPERKQPT